MAVDLSEFRDLSGVTGFTGRCSAAEFIASLTEQEQEQVAAALSDASIQATAIHRFLQRRGYMRRAETIRVHRRGACACGRP